MLMAEEALSDLPGDVPRGEIEAAADDTVRAEARRMEAVVARARLLAIAASLVGVIAILLSSDLILATTWWLLGLLIAWGGAAWVLVRELSRGAYRRWMRIVLPLADAALVGAAYLLASKGLPSPAAVAVGGAAAVLVAFLGPLRLSRSGTRVSAVSGLALWAFVGIHGGVPPGSLLGVGLVILAGTYIGLRLTVGIRRLITEQVRNARLKSLYEIAQEGLDARQQVLAVVCHDLRNPLTTILATAELLLEIPLKEPDREYHLRTITRVSGHMDRLIHDLLDVARIEAGRLSVSPQPTQMSELLQTMEELTRPVIDGSGVQFDVRADQGVHRVLADPHRIQQVFSNLLGNAAKFTPRGGRISVEVTRAGLKARVAVRDTGPGIPPGELAELWKRLWQAEPGDRRGMGLGLTIARAIVEAHGERIGVESTLGAGSEFWFTLALVEE